jgi:hypothetical protein
LQQQRIHPVQQHLALLKRMQQPARMLAVQPHAALQQPLLLLPSLSSCSSGSSRHLNCYPLLLQHN